MVARSKIPLATGSQYGLSISSTVVTLTVPAAADAAELYVRTNPIVFTRNVTDPTATAGTQANPGDIIVLDSRSQCERFEAIRQSADATVDVEYFRYA